MQKIKGLGEMLVANGLARMRWKVELHLSGASSVVNEVQLQVLQGCTQILFIVLIV
jgi:hypothetical protein